MEWVCLSNLGVWHEQVHPPAWLSSQQLELVCNKPSVLAFALVLSFNLFKVRSREECYFRDSIWRLCQQDPLILLLKMIPCLAFSPIFNSTSLEQGIQSLSWTATITLCSILSLRSDQISGSVESDSLRPHESQHARLPCPFLSLVAWKSIFYIA